MDTDLIVLRHFIERHPLQAAHLLEELKDEEVSAFFGEAPLEMVIALITRMNVYKVAKCLELTDPNLTVRLLEKIDIGTVVTLLRQTDERIRMEWLNRISADRAAAIRQQLDYPLGSVGAIMLPLTFALRKDIAVKDAVNLLKNNQDEISLMVPIVDEEGRLVGGAPLHKLLFAEETDQISSIMKAEIPRFYVEVSIESIRNHEGWNEYRAIPVVDRSEKLIGTLDYISIPKNKIKPGEDVTKQALETSTALGELYRIGLTGLLQSISPVK